MFSIPQNEKTFIILTWMNNFESVNRWWNTLPEDCNNFSSLWEAEVSKNANSTYLIKDAILQAYSWVVWTKRNEAVFHGGSFNPLLVANEIQALVFCWVCNRGGRDKSISWHAWSCNPVSL